jgi:acetate kinase
MKMACLWEGRIEWTSDIEVVGHRVVHGGPILEDPAEITPEVRAEIASMAKFAPLHIGSELEGMEIVQSLLGSVPQMAVFDTGFYRRLPLAAIYPGPYEWLEKPCCIAARTSRISPERSEIPSSPDRAQLAFDIYVHRLRAAIGSMAASLGGMDALVFTAGMGENSSEVRAAACKGLEFPGISLDSELNARPTLDADVSSADSRVRVLVIRAEEDWAIAAQCWKLLGVAA